MTAVLLTAMLITGPTVDNTWAVADAGSLGVTLPDATGAPPAQRIDRDRIATEQKTAAEDDDAVLIAKWRPIAECESGNNPRANTGNGYYGMYQFTLTSWRGVGGTGYPHQASVAEQTHRAERLLAIQGWGAWPVCSRKAGYR